MKIVTLLSEIEIEIQDNNEKLWIANSESLIKLITKTNLSNLLSDECVQLNLEEEKKQETSPEDDHQSKKYSAGYFMSLFSGSSPKK